MRSPIGTVSSRFHRINHSAPTAARRPHQSGGTAYAATSIGGDAVRRNPPPLEPSTPRAHLCRLEKTSPRPQRSDPCAKGSCGRARHGRRAAHEVADPPLLGVLWLVARRQHGAIRRIIGRQPQGIRRSPTAQSEPIGRPSSPKAGGAPEGLLVVPTTNFLKSKSVTASRRPRRTSLAPFRNRVRRPRRTSNDAPPWTRRRPSCAASCRKRRAYAGHNPFTSWRVVISRIHPERRTQTSAI